MSKRFSIPEGLKKIIPKNKIVLFVIIFMAIYLPWYFIDKHYEMAHYGPFFVRVWFFAYHILLKSVTFLSVHLTSFFTDVPITTSYRIITLGDYGALSIGCPVPLRRCYGNVYGIYCCLSRTLENKTVVYSFGANSHSTYECIQDYRIEPHKDLSSRNDVHQSHLHFQYYHPGLYLYFMDNMDLTFIKYVLFKERQG